MNLTLPLRMLAAVAPFMGDRDGRYYLNGVRFERVSDGVIAVATNGSALIVARETLPDIAPFGSFTLPRDLVLTLLKGGRAVTHFSVSAESVACGGSSHSFAPIGGEYPDWRGVCSVGSSPASAAAFAPDVLGMPLKSAQALRKRGVIRYASVVIETHSERSAAFALNNLPEGFCVSGVVMPLRETAGRESRDVSADLSSVTRP